MNMMMMFNDTCPRGYEPPGFHANHDPNPLIAQEQGVALGSVKLGYYGYSVPFRYEFCL